MLRTTIAYLKDLAMVPTKFYLFCSQGDHWCNKTIQDPEVSSARRQHPRYWCCQSNWESPGESSWIAGNTWEGSLHRKTENRDSTGIGEYYNSVHDQSFICSYHTRGGWLTSKAWASHVIWCLGVVALLVLIAWHPCWRVAAGVCTAGHGEDMPQWWLEMRSQS